MRIEAFFVCKTRISELLFFCGENMAFIKLPVCILVHFQDGIAVQQCIGVLVENDLSVMEKVDIIAQPLKI